MSNHRRTEISSNLFRNLTTENGRPLKAFHDAQQIFTKGPNDEYQKKKDNNGNDVVILKGYGGSSDDVSINLNNIEATLNRLKENQAQPIRNLKGDLDNDFKNIIQIIRILFSTAAYDYVHEIIVRVFCDVKTVTPGTIGAYFAGCLVRTNFPGNPGCSAVCAGAVPPEQGTKGFEFCEKYAIIYDSDGTLISLNDLEDKEEAYIYISNSINFEGFTSEEIKQLSNLGIKRVKLVRYSPDGLSYQEVSSNFIDVNSLPVKNNSNNNNDTCSSNTGSTLLILLLPLLLLLLIFIGWKFCGSQ
jgi:hypothetical protein